MRPSPSSVRRALAVSLLVLAARVVPAQLSDAPAADDAVAATVNGHAVLESEVESRLLQIVAEQTNGQMLPDDQMGSIREALHDDLVDLLVDDILLDQAADADDITLGADEVRAQIEREVDGFLVKTGTTRDEFAERVHDSDGVSLDEFLSRRAADADYVRGLRHARLMDARYPERTAVSDDEIAARYDEELPDVYDRPAMVHARHILVACDEDAPEDEVAAARQRADTLLEKARTQDVSFEDLARDNSDDGSSVDGGDLGFFPHDGIPFEAFADAAFALEPGQISEPVRTPYGFHVIQCVARKPAEVVPLERAAASIQLELHWEKLDAVRTDLVAELRAGADIHLG